MSIAQRLQLDPDQAGPAAVTPKPETRPRRGHQRNEIVRMNELVPEAGIDLRIENLLQPVDDDLVPVGVAKLLVVGQPEIGVMMDAEIDGDQRHAHRDHDVGRKPIAGGAFHRVQHADARNWS